MHAEVQLQPAYSVDVCHREEQSQMSASHDETSQFLQTCMDDIRKEQQTPTSSGDSAIVAANEASLLQAVMLWCHYTIWFDCDKRSVSCSVAPELCGLLAY